jgi:hypothetical protein
MVAHRIADPLILRLIGKWLNAGYMLEGVVVRTEEGSPQGGPIRVPPPPQAHPTDRFISSFVVPEGHDKLT